jgi:hypothetical protein
MRNQCQHCTIIAKIKKLQPSKFFKAPKIAKFSVSLNMTMEEISQHIRDFVLDQKKDLVDHHFNEMLLAWEVSEQYKSWITKYQLDCHEILEDLEKECLETIESICKGSSTDEVNFNIKYWREIQEEWKKDFNQITYIIKKALYILQWNKLPIGSFNF